MQVDSPYVAIMRQDGGLLKFLGDEAWENLVHTGGVADMSVHSVHCFVKGAQPMIYRNSFELRDKLGRFATSTSSFSYEKKGDTHAVGVLVEKEVDFVESKATAIKNIMDLATHTVIRYVEMMLQIKVLKLSVDYVIDTKSQLWMLWTSNAHFARVTSLGDIKVLIMTVYDLFCPRSALNAATDCRSRGFREATRSVECRGPARSIKRVRRIWSLSSPSRRYDRNLYRL